MRRRSARALALAAVVALGAAGCTSFPPGGGGADEATVRVYSARHYDLEQAFTRFYEQTGVEVEFLFGSDTELRERILAEGEDTLADVYLTVDAGNLAAAADDGIFAPLDSAVLDEAVPASLRDPQDRWFGLAQRVRTIVYDPDAVDPSELSTYEALADPRWRGRLCLRQASASYTQSLVADLLARDGEEETERVVRGWADNADIFTNDVEIIENVDSGRCEVGVVNHYYLARELEEDPDLGVELFWADQEAGGAHVNISGGGVTAQADDPEPARRLLEWLATDGQQAFTYGNHEIPVNPEVPPDPVVAQFGPFTADSLDAEAYAERNGDAVALLARAGYR